MRKKAMMTIALLPLLALPEIANAATLMKSITINNISAVVASGSFSYDSSKTGVISYGDLTSFVLNIGAYTFDLPFVSSLGAGSYVNFSYDTSANNFVPTAIPGSVGTYSGTLAGVNAALNDGFFFDPLPSEADPAGTGSDGIYALYNTGGAGAPYTSITVAAVPEPAAWGLMVLGFGLAGAALRRRPRVSLRYA